MKEEMLKRIEDMPEGTTKEYMKWEFKVISILCNTSFIKLDGQLKNLGLEMLQYPLLKYETYPLRKRMLPTLKPNAPGDYEGVVVTVE